MGLCARWFESNERHGPFNGILQGSNYLGKMGWQKCWFFQDQSLLPGHFSNALYVSATLLHLLNSRSNLSSIHWQFRNYSHDHITQKLRYVMLARTLEKYCCTRVKILQKCIAFGGSDTLPTIFLMSLSNIIDNLNNC